MSALRIDKRKSNHPKGKLVEQWCSNNCNPGGIPRNGIFKITILDYPAGLLCLDCAKKWRGWWDEAAKEKDDSTVEMPAKTAA